MQTESYVNTADSYSHCRCQFGYLVLMRVNAINVVVRVMWTLIFHMSILVNDIRRETASVFACFSLHV